MTTTSTADRIKSERLRLKLTTEQAAARLGMARQSYVQLEGAKGRKANPTLETLVKLRQAGWRIRAIAPELFEPRTQ